MRQVARETRATHGGVPARRRWSLVFASVWLVYLSQPVSSILHSDRPPVVRGLGIGLTALFVAVYIGGFASAFAARGGTHPPSALRRTPAAVLVVIVLVMPAMAGVSASSYVGFAIVLCAFSNPPRLAWAVIGGLVAWATFLPVLLHSGGPSGSAAFATGVVGLMMIGARRIGQQERQIERARDELAQLAVSQERARFARDLYDILGHTLTAITVKAEPAGRLIERSPARAAVEIADIERLAREALADTRSTVTGYREMSLPGEIATARAVLSAAGIEADLPGAVDEVTGSSRELFAWAVREGVTNVLRHSGATRCSVRVTPTSIEIGDNGNGGAATAGNGLAGLRERAQAAGAVLSAGPVPEGGFRLRLAAPHPVGSRPQPANPAPVGPAPASVSEVTPGLPTSRRPGSGRGSGEYAHPAPAC